MAGSCVCVCVFSKLTVEEIEMLIQKCPPWRGHGLLSRKPVCVSRWGERSGQQCFGDNPLKSPSQFWREGEQRWKVA